MAKKTIIPPIIQRQTGAAINSESSSFKEMRNHQRWSYGPIVNIKEKRIHNLSYLGLSFERGGAHLARTMMLNELQALLAYVDIENAQKSDYLYAIETDNCLGKRSGRTRKLTAKHLADLYALDPSVTIFRALYYYWKRDPKAQPLLALLCAYARDGVLRSSSPFILQSHQGKEVFREDMEAYLDAQEPGRFSKATLKSTAQNISSTWTQSGHLSGRVHKIRSRAEATPGSVSYALFLGYITGARGPALFETEYARLLDCPKESAIEMAVEASRRGWMVFKRVGKVMEALFPNLLTAGDQELIHEQG